MRVLSVVLLVSRALVGVSSAVRPARARPRPVLGRAPESERTVTPASVDARTLPLVSERTVMSASVVLRLESERTVTSASVDVLESERTVISASVCR